MSAVLHDLPLPARLVPWHPALHTTLARCLLLALLLHLWLVLMLGSAPGGTAPPGEGVGGRLNITLRGPVADGVATLPQPPATPAAGTGPAAAVPRWGGSVREREFVPADSLPGAAQLGLPAAPVPLPAPETAVRPAPVPIPAPPAPPAPEPGRVLQERSAAPELPPPLLAPPPAPVPEPAPAEGRLLAPAPAAPLNNVRLAPTPALAAPGPLLPRLEGPLATVAQPAPARELVSPVLQGPRVVPVPALPTPAASERAVLPPAMAPLPSPTATPDLPPPVAPPAAAPSTTPSTTPSPAVAAPNLPDATSPADAGSRIGHDVATPGSAAASAPKKLNLELARPRGGELSRMGSVGALPVLPRLPDNDKLARDIEKAGRADCAKAYREAGLMAAVPLVVDALKKDGGCKW